MVVHTVQYLSSRLLIQYTTTFALDLSDLHYRFLHTCTTYILQNFQNLDLLDIYYDTISYVPNLQVLTVDTS